MKVAICPGTFDPVTNGHIDIIKRAAAIFEKIIVAVAENTSKKTLFSCRERVAMVHEATQGIKGVTVEEFKGLVVDFARKKEAKTIIRGLRMISDFEYEFQMALTNRNLAPDVETIFFMPHPNYSYISSRLIKEVISLGADLHQFLPGEVIKMLKIKLNENSDR
ncbi:MAG: pantetheine-phosphate adenylyltransferase [Candidatus Omnitrophica bacterium]|nr:pantetheine-phosphate adenylyltransferase [Candidatus Omnitrophota bacterium]MDD5429811.1 pantetheine-phosphate adenylyltransferase [Candidatus Omnitrophota bacterium]